MNADGSCTPSPVTYHRVVIGYTTNNACVTSVNPNFIPELGCEGLTTLFYPVCAVGFLNSATTRCDFTYCPPPMVGTAVSCFNNIKYARTPS